MIKLLSLSHYTFYSTRGTKLSQNANIKIYLGELLKESGLSKNKFCQTAEIQRSQLKGYSIIPLLGCIQKYLCKYAVH